MRIYRNMYTKNERQHVTTWHFLNSRKIPNPNSLILCIKEKKKTHFMSNSNAFPQKIKLKPQFSPSFLPPASLSSSSLSSADLAQPVVCLGVGDDGLNGDDGLVDLCLELPQLLDVQQSEDLGCFIQSCIWEETYFTFWSVKFYWIHVFTLYMSYKVGDPWLTSSSS